MSEKSVEVVGGVDTHRDNHVAAAVDSAGRLLGAESFPDGRRLWRAARLVAVLGRVGARRHRGHRQLRRRLGAPPRQRGRLRGGGESPQPPDATAPRQVRCHRRRSRGSGRARRRSHRCAQVRRRPGGGDQGAAHRPALGARGPHSGDQPDPRRDRDRPRGAQCPAQGPARRRAHRRLRPHTTADPVARAAKAALRILARRYRAFSVEIRELDADLLALCQAANPALLAASGVGANVAAALLIAAGDNPGRMRSEASFAALCGACPSEASSGTTVRHRLNRGGDRHANNALWRIATVRLSCDQRSRDYAARRRAEGKTRREIVRCLKRHIAREIYRLLTNPPAVPHGADLRQQRHQAKITLTTAAQALDTHPGRISALERGNHHNSDLATRYQNWLTQHAA